VNEILLSGSVPVHREGRSRAFADQTPPDADRHVAEAVRGIAAATFDAEARLVFGGHPSITPLVAQVAADLGLEGSWNE